LQQTERWQHLKNWKTIPTCWLRQAAAWFCSSCSLRSR
jgi:hypothetical protein